MGSWMKDLQERMRRASTDVNTALQPRVAQAKRQFEEGIEQMGLKRGRDVYADDPSLAHALAALDALRAHLRALAAHVDAQRGHLLAAAQSQRLLSELLAAPVAVVDVSSSSGGDGGGANGGGAREGGGDVREDARRALAEAQLAAAGGSARFALDMATPMADLARTFEETYSATITPLKKRYAAQKAEYMRYLRQADAAADDVDEAKRERLEAVARSARPVWERTSETLQGEIRSLVAHATSSLSEWNLNVAQAQAETYARAARAFEEPKRLAEKAQEAGFE